jgi:hypothetical protein
MFRRRANFERNYEEVIESLSRLADAGLLLHVAAGKNLPRQS